MTRSCGASVGATAASSRRQNTYTHTTTTTTTTTATCRRGCTHTYAHAHHTTIACARFASTRFIIHARSLLRALAPPRLALASQGRREPEAAAPPRARALRGRLRVEQVRCSAPAPSASCHSPTSHSAAAEERRLRLLARAVLALDDAALAAAQPEATDGGRRARRGPAPARSRRSSRRTRLPGRWPVLCGRTGQDCTV